MILHSKFFNLRTFSEFDVLFKSSANEILQNACADAYDLDDAEDLICTENYFGTEICSGSSGAFLGTSEGNFHVVHGIALFGPPICGLKAPSVFTSIANFTDWIEGIVWPKAASIQGNVASGNQNGDATHDVQDTTKVPDTPHEDRIIFPE